MPWCPKCKIEYKEGIKICSDCGSPLLNDIDLETELIVLTKFNLEQENLSKRLVEYLQYSDIRSADYEFDKKLDQWNVLVSEEDFKDAKKLYSAFSMGNQSLATEQKKQDDDSNSQKINDLELLEEANRLRTEPSHAYVKREEKYKDFQSAFVTFVGFGIAGLIFTLLNALGILHVFNSSFQYIVMVILFLIFIGIGISSKKRANVLKIEAKQEIDTTNAIKEWMNTHITKEKIEAVTDPSVSEEINYFNKTEKIKSLLQEAFGELDDSYLDALVEEFYNSFLID